MEIKIDKLGRVVIPISYRRRMGINVDSKLLINFENGMLYLSPLPYACALCKSEDNYVEDIKLCKNCIQKIKSLETDL